jgi:hypothetical protein
LDDEEDSGPRMQQMAFDLEVLAKKKWDQDEPGLGANELPKSLDALGRTGGVAGVVTRLDDGQLGVYVRYGTSSRRWGLAVGPEQYFDSLFGNPYSNWSRFKTLPVATNALFFVGPDR